MSEGGLFRRLTNRFRPAAFGLRRRILLIMTLGTITLSLILAFQGEQERAKQAALEGAERGNLLGSHFITAVGHMRHVPNSLVPWTWSL